MFTNQQLRDQGLVALIILVSCAIAILFFGCAENPAAPTAAENNKELLPGNGNENGGGNPFVNDTVFVAADTTIFLAMPEGADSRIFIQGKKVDFVVRPGAVNDSVTITIIGTRYRIGRTTDLYTYECGPSGLQFNLPLELTQLIDRPDGSIATLLYFDESVEDGDGIGWETVAPSQVLDGKGVFLLSHFSKYGISYQIGDQGMDSDTERHFD